jgi:VWFA-related protein
VGTESLGPDQSAGAARMVEGLRREVLALGTMGALEYVVEGLRRLPGRKSVVLFSSILSVRDYTFEASGDGEGAGAEISSAMVGKLRQLTDRANRASVVLYTIDPRGLQTVAPTGAAVREQMANRQETQAGLDVLARETGGLFLKNSNDMAWSVRQVSADQKGY